MNIQHCSKLNDTKPNYTKRNMADNAGILDSMPLYSMPLCSISLKKKIRIKQIFLLCLISCISSVYGAAIHAVVDRSIKKPKDINSASLSIDSYYSATGAKLFLNPLTKLSSFIPHYSAPANFITTSMGYIASNYNAGNKKFQKILNNKKLSQTDLKQTYSTFDNTKFFGNQINYGGNNSNSNNMKKDFDNNAKLLVELKNKLASNQNMSEYKSKLSEIISNNSLYNITDNDLLNNALKAALNAIDQAEVNNDPSNIGLNDSVNAVLGLLGEQIIQTQSQTDQGDKQSDTDILDKDEDKKNMLLEKIDAVLTWTDRIAKTETAITQISRAIDSLKGSIGQQNMGQPTISQPNLPTPTIPNPTISTPIIPTPIVIPTSTSIPTIPSSFSLQANANLNVTQSSGGGNKNNNKKTVDASVNTIKDSNSQADSNISGVTSNLSLNNIVADYPIAKPSEKLSLRPAFGTTYNGTFAKLPPVPPYNASTSLNNASFGHGLTSAPSSKHSSKHNSVHNSRHASGHGSLLSTPASNAILSNHSINSLAYIGNTYKSTEHENTTNINTAYENTANTKTLPIIDFGITHDSENSSTVGTPGNNDDNAENNNIITSLPNALIRNTYNHTVTNATANSISLNNNNAESSVKVGGINSKSIQKFSSVIAHGGLGGHGTVIRPRIMGTKGPAFSSSNVFAKARPVIKNNNSNNVVVNSAAMNNAAMNNVIVNSTVQPNISQVTNNQNPNNILFNNTRPLSRPSTVQFDHSRNVIVSPDVPGSSDDTSSQGPISRENTEEKLGSDNAGSGDNLATYNNNSPNMNAANMNASNMNASTMNGISAAVSPVGSPVLLPKPSVKSPAFIPNSQQKCAPGSINGGNHQSKNPVKKMIKGSKGPKF